MRSRQLKRKFKIYATKRKPNKKFRVSLPHIYKLAAVALLLFVGFFIFNRGQPIHKDPATIAAFQMPYRAIGLLENYAQVHGVSFPALMALFNVENNFFPHTGAVYDLSQIGPLYLDHFDQIKNQYRSRQLRPLIQLYDSLFADMEVFPIPTGWYEDAPGVMFGNSWGVEHNFQGRAGHFGTAIIDQQNRPGRVPVVSMTMGSVTAAGYHRDLGYHVKITAPSGNMYKYAHLDSISPSLGVGQLVVPGQPLGHMGNTGGGRNAPSFPVHLHVAIQPSVRFGRDFWINPYPILRHLEGM